MAAGVEQRLRIHGEAGREKARSAGRPTEPQGSGLTALSAVALT